MAITNLLKINSTVISKLAEWEVERNKLWTDAGRNMAGDLKATFIGLFPKIVVNFGYLTGAELATVATLLDATSFTAEYWDVKTQTMKSGTYYASDYSTPIFDKNRELYKPFKVSLVPFKKQA